MTRREIKVLASTTKCQAHQSLSPHLQQLTITVVSHPIMPCQNVYRAEGNILLTRTHTGTLKAREEHVRESWIKAMEARIVRGELQKCYRGEGVNQLQNCKELAEKYAGMIRDNKVSSGSVLVVARWVGVAYVVRFGGG